MISKFMNLKFVNLKSVLIVLLILLILVLFLVGCSGLSKSDLELIKKNKDICEKDADCVCGGADKETNLCFMGNKQYYDVFVNKDANCPGFCYDSVKCIRNKCWTLPSLNAKGLN